MYQVGVFISHSWSYSGHYDRLANWLFEKSFGWNVDGTPLVFIDYSIPKNNPIHFARNDLALERAISHEISKCDVVICPTGMYSTHSKWIGKELRSLKAQRKRLLAVNPWGQEKRSTVVATAADEQVGWAQLSVGQGVWRQFILR